MARGCQNWVVRKLFQTCDYVGTPNGRFVRQFLIDVLKGGVRMSPQDEAWNLKYLARIGSLEIYSKLVIFFSYIFREKPGLSASRIL